MQDEEVEVTETTTRSSPNGVTQRTATATTTPPSVVGERVVYAILGVMQALLVTRLILTLLGANLGNAFAELIYGVTAPLVAPFQTLFNYQMRYGFARLELETIVAMIVYALVASAIIAFLRIPRSRNAAL
jgi:hypothetical protein